MKNKLIKFYPFYCASALYYGLKNAWNIVTDTKEIFTASLSDTPRSNLRGCWQGVEGNFGGVDRVLVKVPECLKKDFRSSRVQKPPWILVLFWRVLVSMCLLISKIYYGPNPFCAVLEKCSRVFLRCWHFFPSCRWGVFELSRVLNTPRFLRLFCQGVNGCWWEGVSERGSSDGGE